MTTFAAIVLFAALAIGSSSAAQVTEGDFYTIDGNGGYHFGYNDGRLARQEIRSPEGIVRGAYTYVDANGQVQIVSYTADKHNGFLISGTDLPAAKTAITPEVEEAGEIIEETPAVVRDTPEVAAARAEHLEAVRRIQLGEVDRAPVFQPAPVAYTPEVAAARADHLRAHGVEALRSRSVPIVYVSSPAVQYVAPSAHFHPDYLPYAGL